MSPRRATDPNGASRLQYLEAVTFYHFLQHQKLLTMDEAAQNMLPKGAATTTATEADTDTALAASDATTTLPDAFPLCLEDYIGGITDLTGELMRQCISRAAAGDAQSARAFTAFVSQLYSGLQVKNNQVAFWHRLTAANA